MFSKLKSKLKETLSLFSRNAEKEAEVEEVIVEKEVISTKEAPEKIIEEKIKPISKKEEKKVEQKFEEKKSSEKEHPEKKKAEKAKSLFTETVKEIELPLKFNVATEKYEPDHEKLRQIEKELENNEKESIYDEKIPANEVLITYFVHGTTKDNEKNLSSGWNDVDLSDLGVNQSKELKDKVKNKHFDAIFCSDLKRAERSSKLTFGNEVIIDERLRECNYGKYNGKSSEIVEPLLEQNITKKFPDGESCEDVKKRMVDFLQFLKTNYSGKHIAIVAHKSPQLALDVILKHKTWEEAFAQDWRKNKAWQPGWEYKLTPAIELDKLASVEPEKKGFFSRIFGKKEEIKKEEKQEVTEKETKKPKIIEKKYSSITPKEEKVTKVSQKTKDINEPKEVGFEESSIEEQENVEEPEKKGFFSRVKETISTKKISAEKFEELFWDLEIVLLENNVSVEVIERIKEDLKIELVDKPLPRDVPQKIEDTLKRTLSDILTFDKIDVLKRIKAKEKKPFIIAFFGINGAGKTTSIAKLTYFLQQNNHSVVLAACDTFRAAAIQQLEEHATKLGVKMIKQDYGSDAAAVAFDAIRFAEKNGIDVVLIDTAGRLHSNTNLMGELSKIIRVTKPDLNIFVGESITGNDCIEQARKFNELVDLDGVILTKADVDEKGGAPLSIAYVIKKPIMFLGMGQEYKDLEEFDAKIILERLGL